MIQNQILASLDIGTTSIKVIIAEILNGKMNIIGVGSEKSKGVSKGIIIDIDETVEAIKNAVAQAEAKANVKVEQVIVGVPANQLVIEPRHASIKISNENNEISEEHIINVLEKLTQNINDVDHSVYGILPEEFIVDGFDEIKDPRGMVGINLDLEAFVLSGPKTILHNIKKCVERSGLKISDLVIQPLASASVALSEGEKSFGAVLVDVGGGQTTVAAIHDGKLKYSFVDQEGGDFITRDISIVLNTTMDQAEKIKREHGYAFTDLTSADKTFKVKTVGNKDPEIIDEKYLSEIIEARVAQIFETTKDELDTIGALDLPGGIILTGGGSSIPGLTDLAEEIFETAAKIYIPDFMGVRYPSFTNAVGLVNYAYKQDEIQNFINRGTLGLNNKVVNVKKQREQNLDDDKDNQHDLSRKKENETSWFSKIKEFFISFFD
ncbi:cell division protein FtsA [Lacticigenium naphthae]|uniref:cell division protein FtsA n=1 Tax=Lacticigenium naphthae TaxID=515351 RepID=UPI00040FDF49|nr:cell division protein FtsA [Lacticigenium naphthae]